MQNGKNFNGQVELSHWNLAEAYVTLDANWAAANHFLDAAVQGHSAHCQRISEQLTACRAQPNISFEEFANRVAQQLRKDKHYEVQEKEKNVVLTEEGVEQAERILKVDSLYVGNRMDLPSTLCAAAMAVQMQ